jgi:hypothetical protein
MIFNPYWGQCPAIYFPRASRLCGRRRQARCYSPLSGVRGQQDIKSQKGSQSGSHFHEHATRRSPGISNRPRGWIDNLDLIDEYNAAQSAHGGKADLKSPIPPLPGNWTDNENRRNHVVFAPRQNDRWSPTALLMADRIAKIDPKNIARIKRDASF